MVGGTVTCSPAAPWLHRDGGRDADRRADPPKLTSPERTPRRVTRQHGDRVRLRLGKRQGHEGGDEVRRKIQFAPAEKGVPGESAPDRDKRVVARYGQVDKRHIEEIVPGSSLSRSPRDPAT